MKARNRMALTPLRYGERQGRSYFEGSCPNYSPKESPAQGLGKGFTERFGGFIIPLPDAALAGFALASAVIMLVRLAVEVLA